MSQIKYLKQPGYLSDLLFIFVLQHNRDTWVKRFVNLNNGNDDVDFYNEVLRKFPKTTDELLPFFYLHEDRAAFITQYYHSMHVYNIESGYDLQSMCKQISNVKKFKENLIK